MTTTHDVTVPRHRALLVAHRMAELFKHGWISWLSTDDILKLPQETDLQVLVKHLMHPLNHRHDIQCVTLRTGSVHDLKREVQEIGHWQFLEGTLAKGPSSHKDTFTYFPGEEFHSDNTTKRTGTQMAESILQVTKGKECLVHQTDNRKEKYFITVDNNAECDYEVFLHYFASRPTGKCLWAVFAIWDDHRSKDDPKYSGISMNLMSLAVNGILHERHCREINRLTCDCRLLTLLKRVNQCRYLDIDEEHIWSFGKSPAKDYPNLGKLLKLNPTGESIAADITKILSKSWGSDACGNNGLTVLSHKVAGPDYRGRTFMEIIAGRGDMFFNYEKMAAQGFFVIDWVEGEPPQMKQAHVDKIENLPMKIKTTLT